MRWRICCAGLGRRYGPGSRTRGAGAHQGQADRLALRIGATDRGFPPFHLPRRAITPGAHQALKLDNPGLANPKLKYAARYERALVYHAAELSDKPLIYTAGAEQSRQPVFK